MKKKKRKRLQQELRAVEESYAGTLNWLEQGELRSWAEAGSSPFTNPEQTVHEDGTPFDFIEWHRNARWVTVTVPFPEGPSDRELFDFYTNRKAEHGSLEETRRFLRNVQTFLGCEVLSLVDFLKEKGLLYEYLRYKNPTDQAEEELPF